LAVLSVFGATGASSAGLGGGGGAKRFFSSGGEIAPEGGAFPLLFAELDLDVRDAIFRAGDVGIQFAHACDDGSCSFLF
jgi:hypothetical protein